MLTGTRGGSAGVRRSCGAGGASRTSLAASSVLPRAGSSSMRGEGADDGADVEGVDAADGGGVLEVAAGGVDDDGMLLPEGDDEVAGAFAPGTSVSRRGGLAMPLAGGGVGAGRGRSVVMRGCSALTEYQM